MFRNLFNTFKRKQPKQTTKVNSTLLLEPGWYSPQIAEQLLNTPLREQYLNTIWQNVSMSPEMFKQFYRQPIEKYAEMVQLLPASESHHHSHIGGMLDHGLEVISIAARLRQSYVLPQNSPPEDQAKQRDVWTAVVIYAALLHDIGKVAVDIEVSLKDGSRWLPWQGVPLQAYNFRYIKERDYGLHPKLGGFFANLLIPQAAFDWIATYSQAFSYLMYFISDHTDRAGILSEIIQKADRMSVTLALGGDPTKLAEQPKVSFAKQLQIALRHIVEQFKLNAPKGGGEGWLTEDGLWLMSKTAADSIRAHLLEQGVSVPSQNGKIFDELQTHNLIEKNHEGTAIWYGKVISNANWAPAKPFSLLKINPNTIWDSLDKRPALFEGRVTPTNVDGEAIITSQEMTHSDLPPVGEQKAELSASEIHITEAANEATVEDVLPSEQKHQQTKDNADNGSTDPLDFALSLFETVPQSSNTAPTIENISESILNGHGTTPESIVEAQPTITQLEKSTDSEITNEDIRQFTHSQKSVPDKNPVTTSSKTEPVIQNNDPFDAQRFILWVRANILNNKLGWNNPKAQLHIVEDHLFLVTPSIFQIYLRQVTGSAELEAIEQLQRNFQNLGIHKRQYSDGDSRNIWLCEVIGPKKQSLLNGYLIENKAIFFDDRIIVNNQRLKLKGTLQ